MSRSCTRTLSLRFLSACLIAEMDGKPVAVHTRGGVINVGVSTFSSVRRAEGSPPARPPVTPRRLNTQRRPHPPAADLAKAVYAHAMRAHTRAAEHSASLE